jgi:CrcB protein
VTARADRRVLAAIFLGGFAGATARALVGEALVHDPGRWPWATLLVNVAGAFVLGHVITRVEDGREHFPHAGRLLGTGFCGALTTFSTLQLEVLQMLDAGRVGLAGAYLAVSVAAGLAAVGLATRLTRGGGRPPRTAAAP